ncbi:hypothetical protein [Pannonibacter phragmitetus]|uniref:hypothetical protein n=1 Tax=Pannonibacter phragmitetus TaxID=121719 RepID=UPI000ABFBB1E|nr:hypothetical protein [Pannonibacter phragmitetus]
MSKTMHPLPKRSASAVELPAGDEGLRSKGLRLALGSGPAAKSVPVLVHREALMHDG